MEMSSHSLPLKSQYTWYITKWSTYRTN